MSRARVKIKLNRSGVRDLLKAPEITDRCRQKAEQIAGICGEGYITESAVFPERIGSAVKTDSPEAYYRELKHNNLLKALGEVTE